MRDKVLRSNDAAFINTLLQRGDRALPCRWNRFSGFLHFAAKSLLL